MNAADARELPWQVAVEVVPFIMLIALFLLGLAVLGQVRR